MGRAIVLTLGHIAILTITALLVGYSLGRWSINNTSSDNVIGVARGTKDGNNEVFVLLVNMKFTSLTHRDTFLEWIEPVCEDVIANEGPRGSGSTGTTLSYQVAVSDKDPSMVVVMERYSDKERGYLEVHRSGPEFLKFRDRLKGMQEMGDVAISGESYLETDLGFV